ncbi:hypothetical protein MD484_g5096, partial [Candolleomyces efflorescens]
MDNHDFGSLYHPENQELATAKLLRSGYKQRLTEVEEQIRLLQAEATLLNSGISQCDRVLAPFRLAPDDVLREIFLQCLPPENTPVELSPSQAPLLLMHVCQRWRLAVLDCRRFWKYIHLQFEEKTVGNPGSVQRIRDILTRSARAPFDLRITWDWGRYLGRDILASVGQSMTGLALHGIPLLTLISLPSGLFPHLVRLALSCEWPEGWDEMSDRWYSIEAFSDVPSLRQVALNNWFFERTEDGESIHIALPWPQLTVFYNQESTYTNPGTHHFLVNHLPHATNLRYLRFSTSSLIETERWSQLPTIRLPNMEGFCIEFGTHLSAELNFLAKLDLPNLTSIRLEGYEWGSLPSNNSAPPAHGRTLAKFQNLVHLSIYFPRLSSTPFGLVIQSLPNIETLDLDAGRCTNVRPNTSERHPLELLEWSPSSHQTLKPPPFPRLRTLILRPFTLEETPLAMGCLRRVIRSRMSRDLPEDGVSLKKVVIYPSRPINREEVIQEYIDLGRLEFEEHTTDLDEWIGTNGWMKDDPALGDWPEIQEL